MGPRDKDNAHNLRHLQSEVDKVFLEMLRGEWTPRYGRTAFRPSADVYYDKCTKRVVIRLELSGIDPNAINLEVDENQLRVSGVRTDERHPDAVYQQMEIVYGRFERTVLLPAGIDSTKASASYHNGYLEIVFPLRPRSAGRRIPINMENESQEREER